MKNLNWKHYALVICSFGAGVCELLAHYQFQGQALPLHMTAGGLLLAANVFGLFSKSVTDFPVVQTPPPVEVPK